ncbi:uncharacterized protein LOC135846845 [Planococcus citri]|uniref:uncharacterized protein LOC135846845 n=1 Tax=Planococcus citri TaxID=170843 RepID=UPI0031F74858
MLLFSSPTPVKLMISAVFRPQAISKFTGYGVRSITTLQKKQKEALVDRRVEKTVYRHFSYDLDRLEDWYDRTFKGERCTNKKSLQKAYQKELFKRRVQKVYRRFYLEFGRILNGYLLTNTSMKSLKNDQKYVDKATEEIITQLFQPRVINADDYKQHSEECLKELETEEKEKYLVMIEDAIEERFLRMLLNIKLYLDLELIVLIGFENCIDYVSVLWNCYNANDNYAIFYERVIINGAIAMEEYYEESIKQDAIVTLSHRLLRNYVLDICAKRDTMTDKEDVPASRRFSEKSQKFIDFVLRNENCFVK